MAEGNGSTVVLGGNAKELLNSYVGRIETLETEKQSIADDIKEVYAEVKSSGFDSARVREVIKILKDDKAKREEKEAIRDLYMHALGMISDLPLGEAATAAALEAAAARKKGKRGKKAAGATA